MAGITQTVPNYIQGISQQPDELKLPGQVNDALNVLPNITKGLEKRPGSEFIKTLDLHGDELEEGKYFLIDQDKKYIGRIGKTGKIEVWDLTGKSYEVIQDQFVNKGDCTIKEAYLYNNVPLSPNYYLKEIKQINITNGGTGYTSTPTVSFSVGLKDYTHNGGAHSSRTAGTYNDVATETITGTGSGAKFNVVVASDGTPTLTMINRGNGYAVDNSIIINDNVLGGGGASNILIAITEVTGTGATIKTVSIVNGVITEILLDNKGSGYTNSPTLTITGGGGSGATAEAVVGALPYLQHTNPDSIQYLTINDNTFFTNRERTTAMSDKVKDTLIDDSTLTADGLESTGQTNRDNWTTYDKNVRPKEAFVELKQIAYNKQYALNFHQPGNPNSNLQYVATKLSAEWIGDDQTYKTRSDQPASYLTYNEGGEDKSTDNVVWADIIYKKDDEGNDIPTPPYEESGKDDLKTADGSCKYTSRKVFTINPTGKTVYNDDDKAGKYDSDRSKYGELLLTATANRSLDETVTAKYNPHPGTRGNQNNLRFELENIGTPHAVSKANQEQKYECMYQLKCTLMHGGEGWQKGDSFVVVMEGTNYRITVEEAEVITVKASIAAVRPEPTPVSADRVITADNILDSITAEFDRRANLKDETNTPMVSGPGWPWTVRKIGNGLYFRFYGKDKISGLEEAANALTPVDFTVTAPNKSLFNILTSEVNNVGDLPTQCRHGYVVKVLNSNSEKDDYYLQFKSNTAPADGAGIWEECPQPKRRNEFARDTMPHELVEKNCLVAGEIVTKFYLQPIDYMPAVCGDEETNPQPSFINKPITNIAFFRNRIVFLAGDSVVLSQAGDYFNFWAKTGMTITPADCIDVAVSSTSPATLLDAIAVQRGLLLFSKEQQFMLTTDNDVLRPETAKVINVSTYSYNSLVKPFSMGTSVGFTNNTTSHSRFMEMANIQAGRPPDVLEQSKLVHSLLPAAIDSVAESKEQGLVLFATSDMSDMVYGYKWFNTGEKRVLSSWFKWKLHGNVIFHAIVDDVYYAIVRADDQSVQLEKIDIKNQPKISTRTGDYLIHLDNMTLVSTMSYSSSTKKTTITIPDNFTVTGNKRLAFYSTKGAMAGQTEYPEYTGGTTVTVSGDWSTSEVYAGYIYKMQVQFPTTFLKAEQGEAVRAESRGSTIVHRVKLNFGAIGYFQTRLERKCRPDWIQDYEMASNCNFDPNCFGIVPNARQTIPIYSRNEDYRLYLESIHTSPCTLHSSSWEGDYNNKFYKKI